MNYPTTIKNLIECYKKLPGIGEKTAERLALATLNINQETLDILKIKLNEKYPNMKISGMYSPPFRKLIEEEDKEIFATKIKRFNSNCFLVSCRSETLENFSLNDSTTYI